MSKTWANLSKNIEILFLKFVQLPQLFLSNISKVFVQKLRVFAELSEKTSTK